MDIEEIKKQYKDEWVLVEITKTDELGQPLEGDVIAHSRSRDDTYAAMKETKAKDVAHFYAGEIPKKGYAVAFLLQEKTEMITASGIEKVTTVILESVAVAGKVVKNVKAIVHDLPAKSYVDGLLGLSFLRHFDLRLNFKEGWLELM